MIILRIAKLHGRSRTRKCALLLERAELDIADGREWRKARDFARKLAEFLASDAESERAQNRRRHLPGFACLGKGAESCPAGHQRFQALPGPRYRVRRRRTGTSTITGAPAGLAAQAGQAAAGQAETRPFYPGLRVFLEDIRSPFNVGSILRTAEALGFEEVLLSPLCADPGHPRAARSSMGAVKLMPWKRCELGDLSVHGPLLALELGGSSIVDFTFPSRGGSSCSVRRNWA
jgi:rRNA methylases